MWYNHTDATTLSTSITTTTTKFTFPQNDNVATPFYFSLDPLGTPARPHHLQSSNFITVSGLSTFDDDDDDEGKDPRQLPSNRCLGDAAVQAGAARLQTIMTTIMGLLSALTTGWWGHFGERHGRTKVLAIVTFGSFLTDLTFILVSTPSSPFAAHGHKLLILAPIFEGALGGWSTLASASNAYLSDCTSGGSRAQIFSRFTGVFYIGVSVGPTIGGYLIKHPWFSSTTSDGRLSVTCVFWIAILCSFVNFILVLFVFPESLDKVKRQRAVAEHGGKGKARAVDDEIAASAHRSPGASDDHTEREGVIRTFLKPLRLFLPVATYDGGMKRRDWSLTFLSGALLLTMVSGGLYQVKYIYAVHTYGWDVGQLGNYISFMSASRAVFLLVLCPWIIAAFKPKPKPAGPATPVAGAEAVKGKPTKAHLVREISFDLLVTRVSLLIDALCYVFVTLAPVPAVHSLGVSASESQALFVLATGSGSLGSGAPPALESLALCIVQTRALDEGSDAPKDGGVGQLFSALAVLQTLGQMLIGPMLFGLVYSETVAVFPKAVFVTAGGLLLCALLLALLVRGPVVQRGKGKKKAVQSERGRSRVSKDLRGGAVVGYGAVATSEVAGPSSA
ncbi:hypothetical protein DXG01_002213 [Tephrocybe rancida]|nr:hypothetical protein DXG01_002213 [Tephrocybe rancida]